MDKFIKEKNRLLSTRVIKGLTSRNIEAFYAETAEEAKNKALEIISKGSTVSWGGSFSIEEIGLKQAIISGDYKVLNRDAAKTLEEKHKIELDSYFANFYLSSCNAITEDGVLVNIDGNGNRVSAIASGPDCVLLIVGMNKVVKTVDDAISRARNYAAPTNTMRYDLKTPCKNTGYCADCKSPDSICCHFLVTRFCRQAGRIKVILVNETLGF